MDLNANIFTIHTQKVFRPLKNVSMFNNSEYMYVHMRKYYINLYPKCVHVHHSLQMSVWDVSCTHNHFTSFPRTIIRQLNVLWLPRSDVLSGAMHCFISLDSAVYSCAKYNLHFNSNGTIPRHGQHGDVFCV